MTFRAVGLSVMVRCRRTHRLSIWGAGSAWAMAGGTALGASAKSGIWGGVDADITAEGVPNAVRQKQSTIVLERRKERRKEIRCPAPPADDCGICAVGSMQPSPCLPVCDKPGESKGDAFPWGGIPRAKGPDLLQYQGILRLTKNGSQMTGREILQQEVEVEGAAYAALVRIIDRSRCGGTGQFRLAEMSSAVILLETKTGYRPVT